MAFRSGPVNIYTVILFCLIVFLIMKTMNNIQNIIIKREDNTQIININNGQCLPRDPYAKIPPFMYKEVQDIVQSDQLVMPSCSNDQRKNFVFLQVYSCASESLAEMFARFILKNSLTTVLPVFEKQYLGWPHYMHDFMYKKAQNGIYNAVVHRMVYNRSRIAPLMPADTVYITNIRDPALRLGDALDEGGMKSCGHMPKETEDVMGEFLRDMERYDSVYKAPSNILNIKECRCIRKGVSIAKNAMAFDLGFYNGFHMYTRDKSRNYTFIRNWLKDMHSQLDIIMIQEKMNQSLVFVKRYMCWGFKDILYVTDRFIGKDSHMGKSYKDEDIAKFRHWTNVDTLLYDMASAIFTKRVDSLGSDFQEEVKQFEDQLATVNNFCASKLDGESELTFPANAWDSGYVVKQDDCTKLSSSWMTLKRQLQGEHDRRHGRQNPEDGWHYGAWC